MNELKGIDGLIRTTRNRMLALLGLLGLAIAVAAIIAHVSPMDWGFGIWSGYTLVPLFLLVMNALYYTDLLLDRFKFAPMLAPDDVIMEDWEDDNEQE